MFWWKSNRNGNGTTGFACTCWSKIAESGFRWTNKIILLSSAVQKGEAEHVNRMGVLRYMTKPVIQSELLTALLDAFAEDGNAPMVEPSDVSPKPSQLLNILLVEDGLVNQQVALQVLKLLGHKAQLAVDGREGVAKWQSGNFDLILIDVQMPEMDGYEATRAIREHEKISKTHIPIIAMTANAMKGDREQCLESGMDDYLSKPVQRSALEQMLDKWSDRIEPCATEPCATEQCANANPVATACEKQESKPCEEVEVFSRETVEQQIPGGVESIKELATLLVTDSANQLVHIRQGLLEGDAAKVKRAAHTIKGASRLFGANRVVELALHIEHLAKDEKLDEVNSLIDRFKSELNLLHEGLAKAYG